MSLTNRVEVENEDGTVTVLYEPWPRQQLFHESNIRHVLAWGPRGTGKSLVLRWDAYIRCLQWPGFRALILRRTMPELQKSHLNDVPYEALMLGEDVCSWNETKKILTFKHGNGQPDSVIFFGHCETDADILHHLGAQWGLVVFDELSTFSLDMFLKISATARSKKTVTRGLRVVQGDPWVAVVRCGSNPLGPGADWMKAWFIDHDVDYEKFPDYNPAEFDNIYSDLDDNPSVNKEEYVKGLKNLPEHVRRAWLNGEFVFEGAYFSDFRPQKDEKPWHVIVSMPYFKRREQWVSPLSLDWVYIVRSLDWGYQNDPWVCHWHALFPNGRGITFKERQGNTMIARDVAKVIKEASDGMRVIATACDPTVFGKHGETEFSVGEILEQNGVPLEPMHNDRTEFGYAVHDWMNTILDDGLPKWQCIKGECPNLIRTLPLMRMDDKDPNKIAAGNDHWVVSLAYFCLFNAPASQDPGHPTTPRWMLPKAERTRAIMEAQ